MEPLLVGILVGIIICEFSFLAWTRRSSSSVEASTRKRLRGGDMQKRVRSADRPLLYTTEAAQQQARHQLNPEQIETAIAFPAASGAARGAPLAWYTRECGNKRITVWATDSLGHRTTVIARIEVSPTAAPASETR